MVELHSPVPTSSLVSLPHLVYDSFQLPVWYTLLLVAYHKWVKIAVAKL